MFTVAVLGASPKEGRISGEAVRMLVSEGYDVIPVTPNYPEVEGLATVPNLAQLPPSVDTVTLYVRPELLATEVPALVGAKPRRVIFNPGTHDSRVQQTLEAAGIECVVECTLVLLRAGRF